MAKWLIALDALAEDLGLVPHIHMAAHNPSYLHLGDMASSSSLLRHCTHVVYEHICRQKLRHIKLYKQI